METDITVGEGRKACRSTVVDQKRGTVFVSNNRNLLDIFRRWTYIMLTHS